MSKIVRLALLCAAVALGIAQSASAGSVYRQLDCIKSTCAQRIATDYYPNPKTWMEADLKFEGTFRCSKGTGTGKLLDGTTGTFFYSLPGDNKATYNANFGGETTQNAEMFFWLHKGYVSGTWTIKNSSVMSRSALTLEKQRVTWGSLTVVPETKTMTCENPFTILGTHDMPFGSYDAYLYSWKIYESDNGAKGGDNQMLVHDFVPAKDANGVAGLYDAVTGEFLTSATATDFVAGTETGAIIGADVVRKPILEVTEFAYSGETQGPQLVVPSGATASGTLTASAVGKYQITVTLDSGKVWDDETTDPYVINWQIVAIKNQWTTLPAVTRTHYCAGDTVSVTPGVSKLGEVVATIDGEPFTGTLPQASGDYVLSYDVAESATYAGLHYAFNLKVSAAYAEGARSLPADYASVEYVSNENTFNKYNTADGAAYMKLNFNLVSNDCIKTKVRFANVDNNGAVFSSRNTSTTADGGHYTLIRLASQFRLDYSATATTADITLVAGRDYDIEVDAGSLSIDGSQLVSNTPADFEPAGTSVYLFAAYSSIGNPQVSNFSKMRMYGFKVYGANGAIKHELVPVQRKSDSVVGFYDLADDVFHVSQNDRAFNTYAPNSLLARLAASPNRVASSPYASGGDVILKQDDTYIHVFTTTASASTFQLIKAMPHVDALIVAGGGGGGNRGGGGGAGGMIEELGQAWVDGEYTVSVGAGGSGGASRGTAGSKGSDSAIVFSGADIKRALGGGGGGSNNYNKGVPATSGGSGGGSAYSGQPAGSGTDGQGSFGGTSEGGAAGGGGGAGASGANATGTGNKPGVAGGAGLPSFILGFQQYFAGGGGSSGQNGSNTGGAGGLGGGGAGRKYTEVGDAGVDGLGGGGAGGGGNSNGVFNNGGKGGSGIVIISYKTAGVPEPKGGKIGVPTAIPGLVYDGTVKTGVAEGAGYTLTGNTATEGGDHTAVAALEEGYTWSDGSTDDAQIVWAIAAAENVWTTAPAIDTVHFGTMQVGSVVLTAGVAKFGEVVATIAKDGGAATSFGGSLPTEPGAYALTYAVEACANWKAISQTLSFTVYPYEIKPWTSSFVADLTTNANRVVSSEFATGGDMILKYPGEAGKRDTYVHVFTDTSVDAIFKVASGKSLADAEILVVGGGGGAGQGSHATWTFYCGGGGEGGQVVTNSQPISRSFFVHVGTGGATNSGVGDASSFTNAQGSVAIVAAGGRGGLKGVTTDGAESVGNGGHGQVSTNKIESITHGGDGTFTTTLGYEQYFGGGGAGGTHSKNGSGTFTAMGGKGGGGSSSSDTYNEDKRYGQPGTDGLGGGGAGGWMTGTKQDATGRKGGSGIVVIRYSRVSTSGLAIIIR